MCIMIFGIIIIRSKIPNSVSYIQLLTPALAGVKYIYISISLGMDPNQHFM